MKSTRPLKVRSLAGLHLTEHRIGTYLDEVAKEYRFGDASWYLYRLLVTKEHDRLSDDYFEMVYAILTSWGMNSRGAKLAPFETMKTSVLKAKPLIEELSDLRLEKVNSLKVGRVHDDLKRLFDSLALVRRGKPKFVTFAKTMHFLCPHLVAPMDRRHTLAFFRKNQAALPKGERQFELFTEIMEQYRQLSSTHTLSRFEDNRWNLNVPKICDNVIIGYRLLKGTR